MNIREIKTSDAKEFNGMLKTIEAESDFMLFESGENQKTDKEQESSIADIIASKESQIYIAEKDNSILGFIVILGIKMRKKRHSRYLVMGVKKDLHRQGIGTALMERAFSFCLVQNIKRLELTVVEENLAAINLYTKFGFKKEGIKTNSLIINNNLRNEWYMAKFFTD